MRKGRGKGHENARKLRKNKGKGTKKIGKTQKTSVGSED